MVLLRKAHKGAFNQYAEKFKEEDLSQTVKPDMPHQPVLHIQRNAEERELKY